MSDSKPDAVDELLAELNAEFGSSKKGRKPARAEPDAERKARNKAFHEQNQPLGKASGNLRLNPEDSEAWRAEARVTHCCIQECAACGDTQEFIGGEFIRFRSIHAFGGTVLRRAEVCSSLFLFDSIEEPLEDEIEWHFQKVARCTGCIRVEQQARAIWEEHLDQQKRERMQLPLLDITLPLPKRARATQAANHDEVLDIDFDDEERKAS